TILPPTATSSPMESSSKSATPAWSPATGLPPTAPASSNPSPSSTRSCSSSLPGRTSIRQLRPHPRPDHLPGAVAMWMRGILAAFLLFALGCAPRESAPAPPPRFAFTQQIEGTTLSFEMLPIPGAKIILPKGPDGGPKRELDIKPFYMGRTEVTLGLYQVFFDELRTELAATRPSQRGSPKIDVSLSQPADVLERPRYIVGLGDY